MRSRAFTLIELLVVIAVVGGLMAVLVPALAKARQQGKSVSCLSNLRQLAIASQVYVSNNDGFYPIAYTNQFTDSMSVFYAWDFTTIQKWTPLERKVTPGLLWEGRTIEEVQQCPSFKGSAAWIADPFTGYNYNTSYIGHGQFESIVIPAMAVMVKRPGRCALFGDGQWSGGANKFMRSPWPSDSDAGFVGRYAGTQGYRHNGRTNVVYCDGHTETVKDCFKNTDKAEVDNIAPGTGFLSPDNSAYDLE
jgi:prepilin-type processing-associated H-X9-DG protein/prepilin-type N-terminal cleavage/methylation domain-containing protein